MKEQLSETKYANEKQEDRYFNDQERGCHQVFKTSTYEEFKDINPDRVEGTCRWVLSNRQYIAWRENDRGDLLWISADPGCGKSVLTRSLVDRELRNTDKHTVCYFFFKDNEQQDNLAIALCALLHQLFNRRNRLIRHAMSPWKENGTKLQQEVAELWRILCAAGSDDGAGDVTVIFDAIDECRPSDRTRLIKMLSTFHNDVFRYPESIGTKQQNARLKFLVTSRPYNDIQYDFGKMLLEDLPTIRLRGEFENDMIHEEIDLVIRAEVDVIARRWRLHSDKKTRLEKQLLAMNHRTYLWLHLALSNIETTFQSSLRPNEVSVDSLPKTVEDGYERILSSVMSTSKGYVQKIFQIIVATRRPLTVEEMGFALGLATSSNNGSLESSKIEATLIREKISQWCGLFVFINHSKIYLLISSG